MKHYDLDWPVWGPYNKKYLGAAHIADRDRGFRFDVNLSYAGAKNTPILYRWWDELAVFPAFSFVLQSC